MYCIKSLIDGIFAILYQEPVMLPTTKPMQRLCSLFSEEPCWMIEPLSEAGLFNSISASFFERSRVLQQFYSQWSLVYSPFNSGLRYGWSVVLWRYRFLKCQQADQYLNRADQSQPGWSDGGRAWLKTALPLSRYFSPTLSARKALTPEAWAFIYLQTS